MNDHCPATSNISSYSLEPLHPFLSFLLEAKGSLEVALSTCAAKHPQWTKTWYFTEVMNNALFAEQVRKLQAQVLLESAMINYPRNPNLHIALLKIVNQHNTGEHEPALSH